MAPVLRIIRQSRSETNRSSIIGSAAPIACLLTRLHQSKCTLFPPPSLQLRPRCHTSAPGRPRQIPAKTVPLTRMRTTHFTAPTPAWTPPGHPSPPSPAAPAHGHRDGRHAAASRSPSAASPPAPPARTLLPQLAAILPITTRGRAGGRSNLQNVSSSSVRPLVSGHRK